MERHPTAQAWLKSGRASRLPGSVSDAFDDYVNALPWAGTVGLDWSRMPSRMELDVAGVTLEELLEWARSTRLGAHAHLAIWYSRSDGGIVVPLRDGITALDELYLHAPGPRFSFGVDLVGGSVRPVFSALLQYGYGDLLVAA